MELTQQVLHTLCIRVEQKKFLSNDLNPNLNCNFVMQQLLAVFHLFSYKETIVLTFK